MAVIRQDRRPKVRARRTQRDGRAALLVICLSLAATGLVACTHPGRRGQAKACTRPTAPAQFAAPRRVASDVPKAHDDVSDDVPGEVRDLLAQMAMGNRAALAELQRLGPEEGRLQALLRELDAEAAPSAWIAEAIAAWGPSAGSAIEPLASQLMNGNNPFANAHALAKIGRASSRALADVVRHTSSDTARAEAARALWLVEDAGDADSAAALLLALTSHAAVVRERAALALSAHWSALPEQAVTALLLASTDESTIVRTYAYSTLGSAYGYDLREELKREILQCLATAARDERDLHGRSVLMESILDLGDPMLEFAPQLLEGLRSADAELAAWHAQTLVRLGVRSEEVASRVLALAEIGAWGDQEALDLLVQCGPVAWPAAVERSSAIANSHEYSTAERRHAVRMLALVGVALPSQANDDLQRLAEDDDAEVAEQARGGLSTLRAMLRRSDGAPGEAEER